jgi:hypothetical protein
MRVLGLRGAECHGIQLRNIHYLNAKMYMDTRRQGGGGQMERNQATCRYEHVNFLNHTKTKTGFQTLVIPKQLQKCFEVFMDVFHSDFKTQSTSMTPLIPGLTDFHLPKKMSFYNAIKMAASIQGINLAHHSEFQIGLATHDLRRTLNTNLIIAGMSFDDRCIWLDQREDSSVNERTYVLKDKQLVTEKKVSKVIERIIANEIPDGLMMPTHRGIAEQNRKAFSETAKQIDEKLKRAGWLISGSDVQVLSLVEVACYLGCSRNKVNRLMREGQLRVTEFRKTDGRYARGILQESLNRYMNEKVRLKSYKEISEEYELSYAYLFYHARTKGRPPKMNGRICYFTSRQVKKLVTQP